ncbi:protein-disulfide reductase DsbD domain-containing protein [Chenggangzhangella methanolivorans]|uniref:Thiol:disulfide interchange protein DsbD N-terminal domain-containing protein n=1 Tax=Chenggangzhangella methanolivorans TaxID=1437009 RepID=A0A9E6R6F9_9HYPH|nr:protein-disulfide reductase DsbD domain-containing protein [Chenggangzhangella methanolivorans]QZN98783.1 hypothetical protein K6K41_17720 [Chenggangzhangella methanolivorans]
MIRFLAAALVALSPLPAVAENASPWAREGAAALRLIDAGPLEAERADAAPGERLAAISIALDPGWKTYWRQPGASGVPPRFDFSGSKNVAEARVAFPAPERADDGDGVTNVYHGEVTFPVTVRPKDPAAPVELRLVADYGVCEMVCVPVRAEAELELTAATTGAETEPVRAAQAATPKPLALGAPEPLAVASVARASASGGAALEIAVASPEGARPELFAETGDGDFAPAPELLAAPKSGRATFRMAFDEPELPKSGLRLTLSAGGRAIETPVALDDIARTP